MIILFMGGSWFTIAGVLGDDLVNVISFIISEDNLGPDKDTIILGNVKQYLNKCFNDDGNILENLGFDTQMESFETLKQTQLLIEEIKNQFTDKLNKFVYNEYLEELNDRVDFNSDEFKLVAVNTGITPNSYNFVDLLEKINEYSINSNAKEKWNIASTSTDVCSSTIPATEIIYHPKNCYPTDKSWVNSGEATLTDCAQKLNDMRALITSANDAADPNSIKSLLTGLNTDYTNYLNSEIDALGQFDTKIKEITDLVKDYVSEDDNLFSFMNCKFVNSNIQVILYYLKNAFKNDIYEVGVYLIIAAFAMPFAISFTILLVVISNEEIEKNKENLNKKNKRKSIEMKLNNVQNNNDVTTNKENGGDITEGKKLKDDEKKVA